MAVTIEIVQEAARTTTGTQNFTKTGFGTAKAAIFIITNALTNAVEEAHLMLATGFTDGTRNYCLCGRSVDNADVSDSHRVMSNTKCISLLKASDGAVDAEASFDAFITDGVRINWTDAPATAVLVNCILLGGSDLSVYAGAFTANATTDSSTDVTAPNFQPDNLFVLGGGDITSWDTTLSVMQFCFGLVDRTGPVQASSNTWIFDNVGTSQINNHVSNQYAARAPASGGQAIEIGSFDSQGFTATTRLADGANFYIYLALGYNGACNHWVGVLDSPTSTGNQADTAPGFLPFFAFQLASALDAVNSTRSTNATGAGAFCICGFTATDSFSSAVRDSDNQGTTDTAALVTKTPIRYTDGAGTAMHVASFTSFDATGWTRNFTTANATVRKHPSLAIGAIAAPSGPAIPVLTRQYAERRS